MPLKAFNLGFFRTKLKYSFVILSFILLAITAASIFLVSCARKPEPADLVIINAKVYKIRLNPGLKPWP